MNAMAAPAPRKGHGCFFYGCLTVIAVAVVLGLLAWALVSKIRSYASDTPADLPVVVLPEAEMAGLTRRIDTFGQAMRDDTPGRLVVTANDINALLGSSPEFTQMGGRINVSIDGDRITARVTLPFNSLKEAGLPLDLLGFGGRHFNGSAKLRVGLQSGRLLVFCDELEANGHPIPEVFMKDFRTKNLAEKSMSDPQTAEAIAKLKSLIVRDGSIILER